MEQRDSEIDISAVAKQALADRQPGEDLDEALLRACKHLYGDGGLTAFEAARNGLAAVAENSKLDVETAARRIAEGSISLRARVVVKNSVTTQGLPQQSLDSLPPDVRDEVEKAIAAGKREKWLLPGVSSPTNNHPPCLWETRSRKSRPIVASFVDMNLKSIFPPVLNAAR